MRTGLPGTIYGTGTGVADPLVTTTAIGTVYRVGGCTQYGRYVGNGSHFGVGEQYSVYERKIPNGYEYAIVEDYGCILRATYQHAARVTAQTSASPSALVQTPLSGVSKTELYVVGALTLGAVLYLALHHRG